MSSPTSFRKSPLAIALALASSLVFLVYIWYRNYNLLGDLFDYSILAAAAGHLQNGLLPYRDFTTPLQSLTIYLCYAAELVFGPRYLSLAYGNLVLGLASYFLLLRLLNPLAWHLQILTATALCVCTFFQHGIIWYNSVALMLLSLVCLQAVTLFNQEKLNPGNVAGLCLTLYFSSMTKLNFHALALGIASVFLATRFWIHRSEAGNLSLIFLGVMVSGIILGPVTEILVNHTTASDFVENVVLIPSQRAGNLKKLFDPRLYIFRLRDFYPGDMSFAVFALGFVIFLRCVWKSILPGKGIAVEATEGWGSEPVFLRPLSVMTLAGFFIATLLLTVTNVETQILTSSFLLIGLVCGYSVVSRVLLPAQKVFFQSALLFFSAYFTLAGGASAFMHSRVRYGEATWIENVARKIYREKQISAFNVGLPAAVPFFEAKSIDPRLEPYFTGVSFTGGSKDRLAKISIFMAGAHQEADASDIYWGEGLEILNRVYGNRLTNRLPLWYHYGATFRYQDTPHIVGELKRRQYEWIVHAANKWDIQNALHDYLESDYQRVENDDIVVYQRLHR